MIHAALWILSACIVIPVVILAVTGSLWVLFANGRWVYTLIVVGILVVAVIKMTDNQNAAAAARSEQNQPLQAQCIKNAETNVLALRQAAVNRGTYTQTYSQQLAAQYNSETGSCKIRYPVY